MSIPEAGSIFCSSHRTKSLICHHPSRLRNLRTYEFTNLSGKLEARFQFVTAQIRKFVNLKRVFGDQPAAAICLDSWARLAFMAACTFSAVAGSEVIRTPTASWIAFRIAAAVDTQVGSPTPLAPNGPVG